jgi:23S rRNA (guanosine2251-2'-O)-methyltransferase
MSEIIIGRNPIVEALRAGRPINKILIDKNITRHSVIGEIINLAKKRCIPVEYIERQFIERLDATSQRIVAYTAAKDYIGLEDLLAISDKKSEPPFYIILDGIEDPQNMGAVLRTAEATGVHGVIIRERRAVGLTAAVGRASAGAIEYIPVARVTNIAQVIGELKEHNIWVTGVDMTGDVDYQKIDFKDGTAIVIGGEGSGLSPLVRKRCDRVAFIPMKGKISSLNASVAAALVMYEAFRQRNTSIK